MRWAISATLLGSTITLGAFYPKLAAPRFAQTAKAARHALVPVVKMLRTQRRAVSFSTRNDHHFFPFLHAG